MSEVIIEGVNVAECNSFLNEYEFPNNLKGGYYKEKNLCECGVQGTESYPFFCKDNSECYFKQFQRAKAELEKYKNLTPFINCKTCSQVKDLKAEIKELKRKNKMYGEINEKDCAYNVELLNELNELKMKNNELLLRLAEKCGVYR